MRSDIKLVPGELSEQSLMFRWTEGDWLATKVDRWITHSKGYTKLKSRWLSKGCQTMLDRPIPGAFWSRSDSEILNSIPVQTDEQVNMSTVSLEEKSTNDNQEHQPPVMNFFEKSVQYDQDIADYIAYLNKPIINMNDNFIEIHQYHYDTTDFPMLELPPIRPPTRRKKHKIDLKKTEIVESKGISTLKSPEYSEFLVKKSSEHSRNIRIVSGRSSDEENKRPTEELDQHRNLAQSANTEENRSDIVVNRTSHVNVRRGETFSAKGTEEGPDIPRGFLSFRTSKKNKSGRRKKKRVVVSEAGINGPIWPAVLLTFDRSISPGPPESADESEV